MAGISKRARKKGAVKLMAMVLFQVASLTLSQD